MFWQPDPVWPVVVLAVVVLFDAIISTQPMAFVAKCWTDVRFPRRWWPLLPALKYAATLGLVAGFWIPLLGFVTTACLVAYFVIVIGMHVAARDFGRNLFLNATGMLILCTGVLVWSFVL